MSDASYSKDRFIQIDDEGYFKFGDTRVSDAPVGASLFENLKHDDKGRLQTELEGVSSFVEAFDEPFVALQVVSLGGDSMKIQMPYGHLASVPLTSLTLDEWDRFHGWTDRQIPFVLSRAAQAEFFRLLEDYDDSSITIGGKKIEIPDWLPDSSFVESEKFWSEIYATEPEPGWDLKGPSAALKDVLAQLKLPKSRILVLGAGKGHDAAFLAQQGHLVTAVDMSPLAEKNFKEIYPNQRNITFVVSDLFDLPPKMHDSYDIVFEHTCYPAINPKKRNQIISVWRKVLTEKGFLLGIFVVQERLGGPPFSSTERELYERMKKNWDFLYWTRWRRSIPSRQGRELVVYAQKKQSV